jgi:hypothetical protein
MMLKFDDEQILDHSNLPEDVQKEIEYLKITKITSNEVFIGSMPYGFDCGCDQCEEISKIYPLFTSYLNHSSEEGL